MVEKFFNITQLQWEVMFGKDQSTRYLPISDGEYSLNK